MSHFALAFTSINALLLLLLPRRVALIPFIIGTCYMTRGPRVDIGPFTFTVIRILLAFGILRVIIRGEGSPFELNNLDKLMVLWATWCLLSSFFHRESGKTIIFHMGLVYDVCCIYFLVRLLCKSVEDLVLLGCGLSLLLLPVAVEMLQEKFTHYNLFSLLGGVAAHPVIREGRVRANGPFAHSILAGTIGAVTLPIMVGLNKFHTKFALIGVVACVIIVFASASSGPILSALVALVAFLMWRHRFHMRVFRFLAILCYFALGIVMQDPPYFIIARLNIVAGSTGWHRAKLIQSAFEHLREWWLAGTDYTRHWMPTGVSWSPNHTDITNYYIQMGVWGGLPLMIIFVLILAQGFSFVGDLVSRNSRLEVDFQLLTWAIGASLFGHAATMLSVSYFDQSFIFIYVTLAVISSIWSDSIGDTTPRHKNRSS